MTRIYGLNSYDGISLTDKDGSDSINYSKSVTETSLPNVAVGDYVITTKINNIATTGSTATPLECYIVRYIVNDKCYLVSCSVPIKRTLIYKEHASDANT